MFCWTSSCNCVSSPLLAPLAASQRTQNPDLTMLVHLAEITSRWCHHVHVTVKPFLLGEPGRGPTPGSAEALVMVGDGVRGWDGCSLYSCLLMREGWGFAHHPQCCSTALKTIRKTHVIFKFQSLLSAIIHKRLQIGREGSDTGSVSNICMIRHLVERCLTWLYKQMLMFHSNKSQDYMLGSTGINLVSFIVAVF